jgi:integral membrane protein
MTQHLRKIAWLEGASLLLLLFVAMPLKYVWQRPEFVKVVGSVHGFLFILFAATLYGSKEERRWSGAVILLGLVAASLPFGTVWFDRRFLRAR